MNRDPEYREKIAKQALDFLNSRKWGEVNIGGDDLLKLDIADLDSPEQIFAVLEELQLSNNVLSDALYKSFDLDKYYEELRKLTGTRPKNAPRFITHDELKALVNPTNNYSKGGPVKGFAEGGSLNLYEQALKQYPVLQQYPVRYTERTDIPGHMESWPVGEEGGPEWPRPEELPMDQFGVEVRGTDSRPEDVLGDISSHHLVNVDPVTKDTYTRFAGSMTPEQVGILNEQYQHAVNSGEKRSFEQWASVSGIPAWFRGYTFSQWPEEFTSRAYTPDQTRLLDRLRHYYEAGEMPASDFERYTEGYAKGGPVKGYAKGDLVSMYNDYHDTSFKDRARATLNDKHK